MPEPLAKLSGWRDVFEPEIDPGFDLGQSSRPKTIYKDSFTIGLGRRLISSLQHDVHDSFHAGPNDRVERPTLENISLLRLVVIQLFATTNSYRFHTTLTREMAPQIYASLLPLGLLPISTPRFRNTTSSITAAIRKTGPATKVVTIAQLAYSPPINIRTNVAASGTKATVQIIRRIICSLTTELRGRPHRRCRGQTRPTLFHGPLERVVRWHCSSL